MESNGRADIRPVKTVYETEGHQRYQKMEDLETKIMKLNEMVRCRKT